MLQLCEVLIIILSSIMVVNSVRRILQTNKAIYLIHIMFFLVFVLPLILDYMLGYPSYTTKYYGFILSYNDTPTRYIYATYILVSQFIMLMIGTHNHKSDMKSNSIEAKKNVGSNDEERPSNLYGISIFDNSNNNYIDLILCCASAVTVALVLIFPMTKDILWKFGWRDIGLFIVGEKYYSTVERLSYISIASAITFLFNRKRRISVYIIFIALIYMSMNVEAKRSILMFMGVIIIAYLLFNTNIKTKKWVFILGVIVLLGFLYYSIYVKSVFRGYYGFDSIYSTLRIDFFRDGTVKMVIYSLLNPRAMHILNYYGESIITQIGALFPLQFFGVQSIGYNAFLTCSLIGIPLDSSINWMTTSIFDEMLANFGIFGFWIAPTILGMFARIADKQNKKQIPLTIAVVMLLLMYSPYYIMWFLQLWLIVLVIEKWFQEKNRYAEAHQKLLIREF